MSFASFLFTKYRVVEPFFYSFLLTSLVIDRWKTQKLTYDERQAALVKRLNAINGDDDEE